MAGYHDQDIARKVAGLLDSGFMSDLIIQAGEKKWNVHKNIVCLRCDFFAKACDGRFKESATSCINLPDDPPIAVEAMLRFLYTGNYSTPSPLDGGSYYEEGATTATAVNIVTHTIADKYGLPQLSQLAEQKFDRCGEFDWRCAEFFNSLKLLYAAPENNKTMRDKALVIVVSHMYDGSAKLRELLNGIPQLATEFQQAMRKQGYPFGTLQRGERRYKCLNQRCGKDLVLANVESSLDAVYGCPYCMQRVSTLDLMGSIVSPVPSRH